MLSAVEVVVGVVAVLDPDQMNADANVLRKPSNGEGVHPFVCVAVSGNLSCWVMLTTKPGGPDKRLEVSKRHRRGGSGVWLTGPSFVNQTFQTSIGPAESFVEASRLCDDYTGQTRPSIDPNWVTREVVPRCREHNTLNFHSWSKGVGNQPRPAVSMPAPEQIGTQVLSPTLAKKVKQLEPPAVAAPPTVAAKELPWDQQIGEPTEAQKRR